MAYEPKEWQSGRDGGTPITADALNDIENGIAAAHNRAMEPGQDGRDGVDGTDGDDGADGVDGKSAYDLAVDAGFSGTVEQWLASLKGADGQDGTDGTDGQNGQDGRDGVDAEPQFTEEEVEALKLLVADD